MEEIVFLQGDQWAEEYCAPGGQQGVVTRMPLADPRQSSHDEVGEWGSQAEEFGPVPFYLDMDVSETSVQFRKSLITLLFLLWKWPIVENIKDGVEGNLEAERELKSQELGCWKQVTRSDLCGWLIVSAGLSQGLVWLRGSEIHWDPWALYIPLETSFLFAQRVGFLKRTTWDRFRITIYF